MFTALSGPKNNKTGIELKPIDRQGDRDCFAYTTLGNTNIKYIKFILFLKQELREESNELKSSHKEIEALSKSILTFLGEVHKPSAEAIQAKVDKLVAQQSK